jgi:hypothetical protein
MNREKVNPSENTFLGHQFPDQAEDALPFPKGIWKGQLFVGEPESRQQAQLAITKSSCK